eukprot:XP_008653631.1 uncharacterized protein LOC103633702 [Zea mays]
MAPAPSSSKAATCKPARASWHSGTSHRPPQAGASRHSAARSTTPAARSTAPSARPPGAPAPRPPPAHPPSPRPQLEQGQAAKHQPPALRSPSPVPVQFARQAVSDQAGQPWPLDVYVHSLQNLGANTPRPAANVCVTISDLKTEERKQKLSRYGKKKIKRNFGKKIKYECGKALADSQPRVRGRFAKIEECNLLKPSK